MGKAPRRGDVTTLGVVQGEMTTPAERLKKILEATRQAGDGTATWRALGLALRVGEDDRAALFRRYSWLIGLPTLVRARFEDPKLVGLAEPSLRRLEVVESFLADVPGLRQQVATTMARFDVSVWDGLDMAHAAILNAGLAEPKLTSDQRREITYHLGGLRADTAADDGLPESVRSFLLDRLRELSGSLDETDVAGLTEVQGSLFRTVGEGTSRPDVLQAHDRPAVRRFWDFVAWVGLATNRPDGSWGLYGRIVELIGTGQPPVHDIAGKQRAGSPVPAIEAGLHAKEDEARPEEGRQ